MKKQYILSIAILSLMTTIGFSQITITKADLLSGSDTIRMSQAITTGIPDPTLTGANYVWDYTSLVPTVQFVDTFVSVGSTPFLYQFYFNNSALYPKYKASFAQKAPDFNLLTAVQLTQTYNYYQNINSGYSIVGFGSMVNGLPASIKYDTIDVVYRYPMNYNNVDSSISKYVVSLPGLGYYGQHQKRVNNIEGWGTLKTPYGTFSVLKVKSTLHITDSIYYNAYSFGVNFPRPVQYEYKWLTSGKKQPMLEIDAIGAAVTTVAYRDSIRAGVIQVGINEVENTNDLSVFPNPATENANLMYTVNQSGNVKLDLLDVYGKLVATFIDEKQTAGTYTRAINISEKNLAKGIYFARLTINGETGVKKIVVE